MAQLKNTTVDDTEFLQLPLGTTAQRPQNPEVGYARYNTDLNLIEIFNGSEWDEYIEWLS